MITFAKVQKYAYNCISISKTTTVKVYVMEPEVNNFEDYTD